MDKKSFWVWIVGIFCVFIISLTMIVFSHKETITKTEAKKQLQIIQENSRVEQNKLKEESKVEQSKIHSKWLPWNKD